MTREIVRRLKQVTANRPGSDKFTLLDFIVDALRKDQEERMAALPERAPRPPGFFAQLRELLQQIGVSIYIYIYIYIYICAYSLSPRNSISSGSRML